MVKFFRNIILFAVLVAAAGIAARAYLPDIQAGISRYLPKGRSEARTLATRGQKSNDFESKLRLTLANLEVDSTQIHELLFLEDNTRELKVSIPRGRPLEWILFELAASANRTPYHVSDCSFDPRRSECRIVFSSQLRNSLTWLLILRPGNRYFKNSARMAILIDNFGFTADKTTVDYLSFPRPLTVALRADEPASEWTARIADHYRKEICIRLPLEPRIRPTGGLGENIVMVHHSDERIRRTMRKAEENIPNFTGFITVMGSRALEDSRVVGLVLGEIKIHHGYIIDMGEARNSLIPAVATSLGQPFRTLDDRIPDKSGRQTIDSLLSIYALRSHRTGSYLVASAPNPNLIEALTSKLAAFEEQGVSLVYVSEIVHHPAE